VGLVDGAAATGVDAVISLYVLDKAVIMLHTLHVAPINA
jgi:hypothetical protein